MTTTLPSVRSTAQHEAAHAASLCYVGLFPQVARIDHPSDGLAGWVRIDWEGHGLNSRTASEVLVCLIMAPMLDGGTFGIKEHLTWPIEPDTWAEGNESDGVHALRLSEHLGLDHVGWLAVIHRARKRSRELPFRALVVAIAQQLERIELLVKPELVELTRVTLGEVPVWNVSG